MKKRRALALAAMISALTTGLAVPARSSHVPVPRWEPRITVTRDNPVHLDLFPGGRGYALQHQSPLYVTEDFGKTWIETPAPEGAYVADFASPMTGYVFTTDQAGRETLKTIDGGVTWTALADPPADLAGAEAAGAYFDVMAAPSENTLVLGGVVSRYFGNCTWQTRVAVYRSVDGGQSFAAKEFPYNGVIHQLEMLDDLHGVMLVSEWNESSNQAECFSSTESVRLRALSTDDGGQTWKEFADEPFRFGASPRDMGVHSVGIASPTRLVLGMTDGAILTSRDGGHTFTRATGTRNTLYPYGDSHFLSRIEYIKFATQDVGYATSAHGAVWKTEDGGLTWHQELSPQADGEYSFSGGLAVATPRRAITAAHTQVSTRIPRH
jgi:photosystem II stability/assembly factor-like uncharacterized protein